jgi:hypothetical protein
MSIAPPRRGAAAALLIVLGLLVSPQARATTLDDLVSGGTLTAGPLVFSDFSVVLTGVLSTNLEDYGVQPLADGFRLTGPLSVLFGQQGTLLLSYTVSALGAATVNGASLAAPAIALGTGASALVAEALFGASFEPLATLFAYAIGGGASDPAEGAGFAPTAELHVVKTIQLTSGMFASVPFIDQRFVVVAEPTSLGLMGLGLFCLYVYGRRTRLPARPGADRGR